MEAEEGKMMETKYMQMIQLLKKCKRLSLTNRTVLRFLLPLGLKNGYLRNGQQKLTKSLNLILVNHLLLETQQPSFSVLTLIHRSVGVTDDNSLVY